MFCVGRFTQVTCVWLLLRIVLAQSTHSEERGHSIGVLSWMDHCVGILQFINPAIRGCAYGLFLRLDIMYLSIYVEGLFKNVLSVQLGVQSRIESLKWNSWAI